MALQGRETQLCPGSTLPNFYQVFAEISLEGQNWEASLDNRALEIP